MGEAQPAVFEVDALSNKKFNVRHFDYDQKS